MHITLPKITENSGKTASFEQCIRKNYSERRLWAESAQTNCFRIYELEMTKYPLAIDYYAGRFCVQYFSPVRKDENPSVELEKETSQTLVRIFGVNPKWIYWRTRAKTKETRQHEKRDHSQEFFTVYEQGLKFKVNLRDYLDTGLFLDHRQTRQLVAAACKGKRLLNLFSYTASFSIQAAASGATFTKSVDMSNTYTFWAEDNFSLNNIPLRNHPVIRADCLKFLKDEVISGMRYDVIVIDPPTISRSKKMDQLFDIQKDYIFLISSAIHLLHKGGVIFFSTNSRKFVFDASLFKTCSITEISDQTIPLDFRDPKIHRCWRLELS